MMEHSIEISDLCKFDSSAKIKLLAFFEQASDTDEEIIVKVPKGLFSEIVFKDIDFDFSFRTVEYDWEFNNIIVSSKQLEINDSFDFIFYSYIVIRDGSNEQKLDLLKKLNIKIIDDKTLMNVKESIWKANWDDRVTLISEMLNSNEVEDFFINIFLLKKYPLELNDIRKGGTPSYDPSLIFAVEIYSRVLINALNSNDILRFGFFKIVYNYYLESLDFNYVNSFDDKMPSFNINSDGSKSKCKMAVMVTGQPRFDDYIEILNENFSILNHEFEVDFYIFTWDKVSIVPPAFSGMVDWDPFIRRVDHKLVDDLPSTLKTIYELKSKLPKTYKFMNEGSYKKVRKEIFNKKFIKGAIIENERRFENKFLGNSEIRSRYESLNQAKQFYGFMKAFEMIKNSKINYDFVMRIRFDTLIKEFPNADSINSIYQNEIISRLNGDLPLRIGADDHIILSRLDTFEKYVYETAKLIFELESLRIFRYKEMKLKSCSHKLMSMSMLKHSISFRNDINIVWKRVHSDVFKIPGILKILNKEKGKIDSNEFETLSKIFSKIDY